MQATIVPSESRIDLWLAACADASSRLLKEYRKIVSDNEKSRERRFHFEIDRRRFLITRALVRTVLARYIGADPATLRFAENSNGRPELATHGDGDRAVSFNVSHTSDLILLGVTCGGTLGIDLEAIRSGAPTELAGRLFSDAELGDLRSQPARARGERFFEYWTLKEAYVKARGMGLSMPFDSFEFDLSVNGCIRPLLDRSRDLIKTDAWSFWQLTPAARYVVAVCVGHERNLQHTIRLRRIVPLSEEGPLAWSLIRQSLQGTQIEKVRNDGTEPAAGRAGDHGDHSA